MSLAAASASARAPQERGPAALLPVWAARLAGFAALACLGVSQWQRMVAGLPMSKGLLWVLLAVLAAGAVVACERLPERSRPYAMIAAALAGLLAAYLAAGLELGLLRPRRLDELGSGLVSGSQALSTVRLPYEGADPWPALVLQLLGSSLVMISGLLALWPRANGTRGYPFLSLAALLVLTASPVVSMGGTRPLLLGTALTVLTVCFLWLERLPLRPGLGVAALIGLALAGALPLASAADRGEPWFDYQAFAEGLGPEGPGALRLGPRRLRTDDWGRTGAEVVRVKAQRPAYWKVRTLDEFDGSGWTTGGYDRGQRRPDARPAGRLGGPGRAGRTGSRSRCSACAAPTSSAPARRSTSRTRAAGSSRASRRASGSRSATCARATPTPPASTCRGPRPTSSQAVEPSPVTEHTEDLNVRVHLRDLTPAEVDALPPRRAAQRDRPAARRTTRTSSSRPFGLRRRDADGQLPHLRAGRRRRHGAADLRPLAHLRAGAAAEVARRRRRTSTRWRSTTTCARASSTPRSRRAAPPGVEPIESFLLDTKAGYCQHFSAGMALLLRMGGVPARVATGFSPGGYSKRKQAWIVRDTDAHSWVEAWFDDYGWVTMDPTPSETPARSQIATLSAPATPRIRPATRPATRTPAATARPTGARRARARSSSTSCAAAA